MSPTFRALRNPNYRLYLAGSVVSNTGTWMQRVAQDWLVLSLPGTGGTELGITTGLQFLPVLILSPYAGVVADRFPKRVMLQLTQLGMAVSSLLLGAIAVSGHAAGVDGLRCWPSSSASPRPSTRRPASPSSPRWSAPTTSPTRSGSTRQPSTSPGCSARRLAGLLIGLLGGGARAVRLGDPASTACPTSR